MPYARATDRIRLYYEEHGPTGPGRPGTARRGERAPAPLVLAYGIGGNTDMWAPNTPGLATGRRVVLWEPEAWNRTVLAFLARVESGPPSRRPAKRAGSRRG